LEGDTFIHGPDFKFCVGSDTSNCGAGNHASFEVQQDHCAVEAGDITFSQINSQLYQATELDQTTGSYSDDVPGIAWIAIFNPSANQ
jgi:hypothetical protein